jgi:guanine deaminase
MEWHRGHLFHVTGSPGLADAADHLVHAPDGGILVDDTGVIEWSGPWRERPDVDAPVIDHHGCFLLPGFVDTHVHFPQVHCVDAFGGGELLEWLERVIFPAEARLADPARAADAARQFCDRLAAAGTTTALVFGSQFPVAQEALADAVAERGLRIVVGRTVMTTGPASAAPLLTDDDTAMALVREEIDRWHRGPEGDSPFAGVAIVPRFALSVEPSTLRLLGELYQDRRADGVYVTSHLSENDHEGDAVRSRFGVRDYLDVYDGRFLDGSASGGPSLLGRRTVLAHAVHASPVEMRRMADSQTSVAHCPVSQGFLGSGTLPWRRVESSGVQVAMGSDIAAGDEWFMPRVLNACFKAHMNEPDGPVALSPAQLLYLGTLAGAQALDLDGVVGNLDAGRQADLVVLDPSRCGALEQVLGDLELRADEPANAASLLFALLMAARDTAVSAVYVGGRRLAAAGGKG